MTCLAREPAEGHVGLRSRFLCKDQFGRRFACRQHDKPVPPDSVVRGVVSAAAIVP